ncbi:hypothetical protein FOZ62_004829, partial [Perkinsus olseni]
MLLEAGFPQLRLEPQHARFMRLQDFYEATLRHLAACEAYAVVQASSVGENVPEYLIVATSKLSRPPRQASTLAMRVNFGRWLSRFLDKRGYQSWPGWFSDGRVSKCNVAALLYDTEFVPPRHASDRAETYFWRNLLGTDSVWDIPQL